MDEYSVDSTGTAIQDLTKKGYLGQDLTDAVELTNPGSLVFHENFDNGVTPSTFTTRSQQLPGAPTPRFEVASIRLCEGRGSAGLKGGRTGGVGGGSLSPGRVSFACGSLANFVQRAYVTFANGHGNSPWGAPPILGGPAWVNSDRDRINAKAEGDASPGVICRVPCSKRSWKIGSS